MAGAQPLPPEVSAHERILGFQALQLLGNWSAWIFRRVESISYQTASSVRRRVSVDFRLREDLFADPIYTWGADAIQYVPLAQLKKQNLVQLDVHDEEGRALPVMTRRKNAGVAAGTLIALA